LGSVLLVGVAGLLEFCLRAALGVSLLPHMSFAPDFEIELVAQGVDHGDAHSVQSAGNFVRGSIELAAGVQLGEYHLGGGNFLAVDYHVVDRNAAAVVHDGNGVVDVDGDLDLGGKAGKGFVHGVVDDLVHQVVQPHLAVGADVHSRTQADGLHPLQDLDVL